MNESHSRIRAFTAMELLATVGLVGIIGTLSLTLFFGTREETMAVKLRSNVESLNRAIAAYESGGGDLTSSVDAQQVLSKLKTVGDSVAQLSLPGYAGSFVDGRLIAVSVDAGDVGLRAVWDLEARRFSLSESGGGVRFELADEVTADFGQEEAREMDIPGFAQASNWIWDFEETAPAAARVTPQIQTGDVELTMSPGYLDTIQLAPPLFSIPGGTYPSGNFPLEVTLSNPPINPAGTAIKYSIDSAPWQLYLGSPLLVSADTHIVAYADSDGNQHYISSFATTHYYAAEDDETLTFAGQSAGEFRDAEGGNAMVANYVTNGLDAEFEWGRGVAGYDSGSILSFTSDSFVDVNAESWFRLGGLDYFNSTISAPTEATSVWLDVTIDFSTPDIAETFAFELALENTANLESNTANQNADYVRITDPNSVFSTSLNGQQYELQLQFGYLGSDGFATVDQFHVHEGARAEADIWGYFVPSADESQP